MPRPARTISPRFGTERHHNRHDARSDDIIRFVREMQMDKQPTLVRLHKKAPLPDIGHTASYIVDIPQESNNVHVKNLISHESGNLDFENENFDDTVHPELRNSHASVQKWGNSLNHEYSMHERVRPTNGGHILTHNDHSVVSRKSINSNVRLKPHANKTVSILNTLPPIPRDDLPERPSAPSPSRTPPLSDEELMFMYDEEPIDYIDFA